MSGSIVKAVFGGAKRTKTRPIYQYDYGMTVEFVGINLPETYEVHEANTDGGTAKVAIGNESGAYIYNSLTQSGESVFVWVFLHDGDSDGYTRYVAEIPVKKRPRPLQEEPTPEQESVISQAIEALNSGVSRSEAAAETAGLSADAAAESADDAAESASNAYSDAERAETAAGSAEGFAQSASESEGAAQGYAAAAAQKAGEAVQSATAAANSATAAGSSASTASGAATQAGNSATAAEASAQAASDEADRAEQLAEKILSSFVSDTETGTIVSITDGANDVPIVDLMFNEDDTITLTYRADTALYIDKRLAALT